VRRRRTAPEAISPAPAKPIRSAGAPVRGNCCAGVAEALGAAVDAGVGVVVVVAAGAVVAAGVVDDGAVDAAFFFFFGALGATRGSWY
jgi:hypothetical protein